MTHCRCGSRVLVNPQDHPCPCLSGPGPGLGSPLNGFGVLKLMSAAIAASRQIARQTGRRRNLGQTVREGQGRVRMFRNKIVS